MTPPITADDIAVRQRIRRGLHRRLPILTWLSLYKRAQLRPDIVAGVVVAALAIPQSLGYASIAGVPVQVGLYAVPIALLLYAALGTSLSELHTQLAEREVDLYLVRVRWPVRTVLARSGFSGPIGRGPPMARPLPGGAGGSPETWD
jgi:hypothetical protein